jgi:hypothetical protein
VALPEFAASLIAFSSAAFLSISALISSYSLSETS